MGIPSPLGKTPPSHISIGAPTKRRPLVVEDDKGENIVTFYSDGRMEIGDLYKDQPAAAAKALLNALEAMFEGQGWRR